jgi:metal-responsive CopG/Arc/MetJ family transcriptional regulator
MGRKKLWTTRLTLPLTDEMVQRMDAALAEGEARVDLIREAVERELKRRERRAGS